MADAPFLAITTVSKQYGGVMALKGVDFDVRRGEVHSIIGENGSGKSTLIKILSGVTTPEPGGTITIDGESHSALTPQESIRKGIQVIYQDLSLFPHLSVAENIAITQHLTAVPKLVRWREIRATAVTALARIGIDLDIEQKVGELSIANRQIVAICRALCADAKLVIMDEPTASLTHQEVERLLSIVGDLKRKDIATVFVSHRLHEVMAIADRITVLRDGERIRTFEARSIDHHQLAYVMTGLRFEYQALNHVAESVPVALRVQGLSKARQYRDISLEVRLGEILGIVGLRGAGRTELALSLFGMNRPDAGVVILDGRPVDLRTNRSVVEHGIAYVSEDRLSLGLVMNQSIGANILITILDALASRTGLLKASACNGTVRDWIRKLSIKVSDPNRPVSTLSGGNQQRVVLAKWMAKRPKLLILDSPTVGVDIAAKNGIYEIIKALAAEGVAIIMISDEVPEVLYHTHRILLMRGGSVVAERRPRETSEEDLEGMIDA